MTDFATMLDGRDYLMADGATGTNYFSHGLEAGYPPELWNVEKPDIVKGLHAGFFAAGSDLVLTNSFGGTRYRLKLHGAEARAAELNRAAARLGREVADEVGAHEAGHKLLVAGSMGPTGELFAPLGALTHDDAVAGFTEQATALAEGGVDLLWVETMSALEEFDAAVAAAMTTGLPVAATMTFDTAGKTMMGIAPESCAVHAKDAGVVAIGANCGVGPAELMESVMGMGAAGLPLIAKGNCGIPEYRDGGVHYLGSPELMARYAVFARDAGVKIIGGCCGTTPGHIAAMKRALDEFPSAPADEARLIAEIGKPWASIPDAGNKPKRRRRRA